MKTEKEWIKTISTPIIVQVTWSLVMKRANRAYFMSWGEDFMTGMKVVRIICMYNITYEILPSFIKVKADIAIGQLFTNSVVYR